MERQTEDFDGETDRLDLAVDYAELERANSWLEVLAERDNWPERARFAFQLSLEEVLANVISHGFDGKNETDASISIGYRCSPESIALSIRDSGVPFDPTSLEETPLPDSVESAAIGGHGVRLIRRMLDQFSYRYANGFNHLHLGYSLDNRDQATPI